MISPHDTNVFIVEKQFTVCCWQYTRLLVRFPMESVTVCLLNATSKCRLWHGTCSRTWNSRSTKTYDEIRIGDYYKNSENTEGTKHFSTRGSHLTWLNEKHSVEQHSRSILCAQCVLCKKNHASWKHRILINTTG